MLTQLRKCIITCALVTVCIVSPSCDLITVPGSNEGLPEPATTVYTIKKGSHYATSNPLKRNSNSIIRFEATFDSTAVYKTQATENQGDINKLYGISDCNSPHQTNSARFGWRWLENRLEIHAYSYINGTRQSTYIGSVELGRASTYELELKDGLYVFTLDEKQVTLPRGCSGAGNGYQLYPYFGGDEAAPHEINIKIKVL
ncbi:hypothetical protein ACFSKU_14320 [Pontibacter silvestris]|uniref:Uncharacterized protein n=1 Tax=Pontibacter silvestris TaxID=2305183 RepID=A0ABW4X0A4_9BACT|nr:hypothetical protein [Pontibacter silvestris]MCC9138232.1 hypothetical protein [Pontibacter silvestris]